MPSEQLEHAGTRHVVLFTYAVPDDAWYVELSEAVPAPATWADIPNAETHLAGHRRFGNVRELPSGRYQARHLGPDGQMRNAPETFARKSDVDRYVTLVEAQRARREWVDPEQVKVKLGDYARRWIDQ